mmetsp:Transcript_7942/g.25293  ORF Transcript_7942/g.25293 Transcript_7942/m.25293 type:complete len:283 (+) Transcript_7942:521-1369(+)
MATGGRKRCGEGARNRGGDGARSLSLSRLAKAELEWASMRGALRQLFEVSHSVACSVMRGGVGGRPVRENPPSPPPRPARISAWLASPSPPDAEEEQSGWKPGGGRNVAARELSSGDDGGVPLKLGFRGATAGDDGGDGVGDRPTRSTGCPLSASALGAHGSSALALLFAWGDASAATGPESDCSATGALVSSDPSPLSAVGSPWLSCSSSPSDPVRVSDSSGSDREATQAGRVEMVLRRGGSGEKCFDRHARAASACLLTTLGPSSLANSGSCAHVSSTNL